jgi:nitrogen fixation negative regulator NifL
MARTSSKSNTAGAFDLSLAPLSGNAAWEPEVLPRLFFQIVEQSPLAISITDERAGILYVNPAFEALTGYSKDEVLGRNESILSHKQTPKAMYDELWTTIRDKRNWRGTLVNRRRNGDAYLAELSVTPVLNEQGDIVYFLGIHRDVTELHALEKQVFHQKALIESVLDSAPVVVALTDLDGRVVLDNQAYKKLLGDLHGQEPAALFLDVFRHEGMDLGAAASEGRGFEHTEVRLDVGRHGESRWFSVSGTWVDELDSTAASYFSGASGRRLLLVASEITVLKRQMEQVRVQHMRASIAEQQRIQGMREALSGAIYQLQSPLNMIQAASSMLNLGTDAEKTREVLGQVLASGHKAMETLHSALPVELQEPESSVNLNVLLQDVLSLMTDDFLVHGVMIDWHPQAVLGKVVGRPDQLRGMLMRVLENALLAVAESAGDHRVIRVTTDSRDDGVEVVIQDNGCGIPEALRLKVFEPFYTAWQKAKGRAGMGLSLVQDVVNEHGGVIAIGSGAHGGCRVRLTFPVAGHGRDPDEGVA